MKLTVLDVPNQVNGQPVRQDIGQETIEKEWERQDQTKVAAKAFHGPYAFITHHPVPDIHLLQVFLILLVLQI